MGFSGFVEVAIGLILMYLVLSLICTTVNELIATGLQWRAKSLSKALTQLIDNEEVRKAFYNYGLISNAKTASRGGEPPPNVAEGAAPAKGAEADRAGKPKEKGHPAYLEGRTFALALLDSLTETKQAKASAAAAGAAAGPVAGAAAGPAAGAVAGPAAGAAVGPAKQFPTFEEIKELASKLPDSNIRDVLLANLATGEKTVAEVRDNLAAWFDSAMDRLTGSYKRWMKVLSLIVGIVIAFALNADSLSVGRALWGDETLRGQLVTAASQYVNKPLETSECKETDPQKQTACLLKQFKQQQEQLRPFPIGWPDEQFDTQLKAASGWSWWQILLLKILGCLWTGLALSLGAPFWFDTLQKFMNVRGAGVKPQEKKAK